MRGTHFAPRRMWTLKHRVGLFSTGLLLVLLVGAGCLHRNAPGEPLHRSGDEIVVAGEFFHTGTPVVLWMDAGGYDGYRVERRFAPLEKSDWENSKKEQPALTTPNRYGLRREGLNPTQLEQVRGGGWSLPELRSLVDQFILHFDASGTSRRCFEVLHDNRGLSVHFLLDVDGTIYQTLDLKERAWHATSSNSRAVGIEIAQVGAFPPTQRKALDAWYVRDDHGMRITFPEWVGDPGIRTPHFIARPAREEPISGTIQGQALIQYDFTPEQYRALARLTATLSRVFPKIRLEYPKDAQGKLIPQALDTEVRQQFQGILGHYHLQTNKVDPGPAFQWDRLIREAQHSLR